MKKTSISLIAVALAATLGTTTIATTAYAHGNGKGDGQPRYEQKQGEHAGLRQSAGRGMGGIMALVCSEDGATRLETMLTRMSDDITLTEDQQVLFDEFSAAATSAQSTYAAECQTPVAATTSDDGTTTTTTTVIDPVEGLKMRVANMSAATAALEEVIPSAEAFYDSLTDEQKASLMPKRGFGHRR